ncbi:hypothetical protein Cgig2_013384 [Carnegiea gigantea]|uniref:RNase H type-1 domain-containing protein n=1 Tax=Carnegiea gigantea TaxID=171969 RepID=A0A9Q1K8J9_9CARY|nr:hypothetical protein Cgig2_013384 [Carnegiea gigantea]
MSIGALATRSNLAKRISDFNMTCHIYGALEDSIIHAFLECPLASKIRASSPLPSKLWSRRFPSALDNLMYVHDTRGLDEVDTQLGKWVPPPSGIRKLDFDAGCLGDWGRGLGFVVRDSLGDVVLAGTHQFVGFLGPDIAEVEARLFGLHQALLAGFSSLVIEGDSFSVISKLRNKFEPS